MNDDHRNPMKDDGLSKYAQYPPVHGEQSSQPPSYFYPPQRPQMAEPQLLLQPQSLQYPQVSLTTPGQQQPLQHVTSVTVGNAMGTSTFYGPSQQMTLCPYCHAHVKTRVESKSTTKTHCLACCCFLLCCPLFWVPYCCKSCQNRVHHCPNCKNYLGVYEN